jgi:hypothetical protein
MTICKLVSRATLSLFLGTLLLGENGLVYAQEPRNETKPEQPEPRPDVNRRAPEETSPRTGQAKPSERSKDKPAPDENKAAKQEESKPSRQAEHNNPQFSEGAHGGTQPAGRIPADKFRAQFGRQHKFTMHQTTVEGQPRFQYGGYWFKVVDPWPVEWAYTDECYIDEFDGEYFLFDLAHPGIRIALIVVL